MTWTFVSWSTRLKAGRPAPPCECANSRPALRRICLFATSILHRVSKLAPASPSTWPPRRRTEERRMQRRRRARTRRHTLPATERQRLAVCRRRLRCDSQRRCMIDRGTFTLIPTGGKTVGRPRPSHESKRSSDVFTPPSRSGRGAPIFLDARATSRAHLECSRHTSFDQGVLRS